MTRERDDRTCWTCCHLNPALGEAVLRCTNQRSKYYSQKPSTHDDGEGCEQWAPRAAGDYRTPPRGWTQGKPGNM